MELWNSVPVQIRKKPRPGKHPAEGRPDKKKKVSPWISQATAATIRDVARYIRRQTDVPCGDGEAARRISIAAFQDPPTINKLAPFLWRDYERDQTIYRGHDDKTRKKIDTILDPYEIRAHIRYHQDEWEAIDGLAFALGIDIAPTTAALIALAIRDDRVMAKAAAGFKARSMFSLKGGTVEWR